MGVGRVVVRLLGLASTTKGFAYACLETPKRLVAWGVSRTRLDRVEPLLRGVVSRTRPLFVCFDRAVARKKKDRGQDFEKVVDRVCNDLGVMVLDVNGKDILEPKKRKRATKWDIARKVAEQFPEIAHKLPEKRKEWETEDDRVGLFLAVAAVATSGLPPTTSHEQS